MLADTQMSSRVPEEVGLQDAIEDRAAAEQARELDTARLAELGQQRDQLQRLLQVIWTSSLTSVLRLQFAAVRTQQFAAPLLLDVGRCHSR